MIDDYVKNWLIKASHDLKAADNELTIESEEILTDIVCFHAQQAAEKYLKAFLVKSKIEFGRSHSLEYLLELCKQQSEDLGEIETGDLSQYAVEIRYAEEFSMPTAEEAQKAYKIAANIKNIILNKLGIKDEEISG